MQRYGSGGNKKIKWVWPFIFGSGLLCYYRAAQRTKRSIVYGLINIFRKFEASHLLRLEFFIGPSWAAGEVELLGDPTPWHSIIYKESKKVFFGQEC